MKPVIDEILKEATILRMLDEARTAKPGSKGLDRAKRAAKSKASQAAQDAEKLGLFSLGGGNYGEKEGGSTVATTKKGKLVFTDPNKGPKNRKDKPKSKQKATAGQTDDDFAAVGDEPSSSTKQPAKKGGSANKVARKEAKESRETRNDKINNYEPGKQPGRPGSYINEDVSMQVVDRMSGGDLAGKSEDEVIRTIYEDLAAGGAAQELGDANLSNSAAGYLRISEVRELAEEAGLENYNMGLFSKTVLAVRNAQIKRDYIDRVSDNLGWDTKKNNEVGFGGSPDELKAAGDYVDRLAAGGAKMMAVKDGKPVEIEGGAERMKKWISDSGGSHNPSDTFSIVENNGEVTVLFTSDKDSPNAIIVQSSLSEEWSGELNERALGEFVDSGDLDADEVADIISLRTAAAERLQTIESGFENVGIAMAVETIAKVKDGEVSSKELVKRFKTQDNLKKHWKDKVVGPFAKADFSRPALSTTKEALEFLPKRDAKNPYGKPTEEEMVMGFLKKSEAKPSGSSRKIIERLGTSNPDDAVENIRKEALKVESELVEKLDKDHKITVDGQEVGIGTYVQAKDVWEKGHFQAITRPEGSIFEYDDMFVVNCSGYVITPEVLSGMIGVDTENEFITEFKAGEVVETKSKTDRVTGGGMMIYAIVKDKDTGEERPVEIMQKVQRSKAGPMGKFESVFNWAKGAREYIYENGNAMDKEKNESVSYRHIQTLLEMASQV